MTSITSSWYRAAKAAHIQGAPQACPLTGDGQQTIQPILGHKRGAPDLAEARYRDWRGQRHLAERKEGWRWCAIQ
jgi:hypothetical protein